MRSRQVLPGIILIFLGVYYLSNQFNITLPFSHILLTWQSIIFFIGLVFSWQGFSNKDDNKMFLGITLLGLGTLFHGVHTFNNLQYQWPYFTLIFAFAFLMKYFVSKRDGIYAGLFLLLLSLGALYLPELVREDSNLKGLEIYWPIILILLGVFLLIKKR